MTEFFLCIFSDFFEIKGKHGFAVFDTIQKLYKWSLSVALRAFKEIPQCYYVVTAKRLYFKFVKVMLSSSGSRRLTDEESIVLSDKIQN